MVGWQKEVIRHRQAHPTYPQFQALGRLVESANPFALWAQAVQMARLPWRSAAQALPPPGLTLPQVGGCR
jgi:hypothetical protein